MKIPSPRIVLVTSILLAAGCATPRVDLKEPRRLLGTEENIRLDASVRTDTLSNSQPLPFDYAITNNRATPIAVAELVPQASFDSENRVLTVTIGTEVPGEELLPRLVVIAPGEKKEFSGSAHVRIPSAGPENPFHAAPGGVQFKLNFLSDPQPFAQLIGISERAVHDAKLAADLFPKWLEGNETLVTNVLPMRWSNQIAPDEETPGDVRPRVRRRP